MAYLSDIEIAIKSSFGYLIFWLVTWEITSPN